MASTIKRGLFSSRASISGFHLDFGSNSMGRVPRRQVFVKLVVKTANVLKYRLAENLCMNVDRPSGTTPYPDLFVDPTLLLNQLGDSLRTEVSREFLMSRIRLSPFKSCPPALQKTPMQRTVTMICIRLRRPAKRLATPRGDSNPNQGRQNLKIISFKKTKAQSEPNG